ncbi:uncharacterized protein LOC143653810 isoform X2 [Tamandua tetradactyla]|uniref:uncharacterized protein LOC143653810 isoform X2 n=1 Tax=Tamandua tetradactyla TaxID=48850 RepID=UPI004054766E
MLYNPNSGRPGLQPRQPELHLSRVPTSTEAISNPSAFSACANFSFFLHASPLLPTSDRKGAYGFTFYVRAPQPPSIRSLIHYAARTRASRNLYQECRLLSWGAWDRAKELSFG